MTVERFGKYLESPVCRYTVTNAHGATLSCLSLGAVWYRWAVPVAGKLRELVIHSPEALDYVDDFSHHGQAIGRMAGRIPTTFKLAGQFVTVDANDGAVNLHGGAHGFYALNWSGHIEGHQIIFTREVTSADDGFPGNMEVTITYTLQDDDNVAIDYSANSDQTSLFNPMNHAYFNLNANDDSVRNHTLWLNSTQRFALGADKLPIDELLTTTDTAYDFHLPKRIGSVISALQSTSERGLDEVYYAPHTTLKTPVASLAIDDISLDFYSDRNAVVVYSANNWQDQPYLVNRTTGDQCGIAVELQTAPSALNDARFGSLLITPEHAVHYQSQYRLRR